MARLRGVTAAGILVIGALVTSACGSDSATGAAGTGPADTATTTTEAPTTEAETTEAETTEVGATKPAATQSAEDDAASGLPSSGQGVTIVELDGFEGGMTLEDEGLSMTDDDSGRQLFTFKPLGDNLYQVRGTNSSGENEPLCWRAPDADEISPSPIVAGQCDAADEKQAFTIVKSGKGYVFSREGSGNIVLGSNGLEYDDVKSTKFRINS